MSFKRKIITANGQTKITFEDPENNYTLSANQRKFVKDALNQGKKVEYDYSGRGMYGARCPAVRVDSIHSLNTDANVQTDNMGLGYVIYAQH